MFYTRPQWRVLLLFLPAYFLAYGASVHFFPADAAIYPASAVAIAALFFGGIALWPVVAVASLSAGIAFGVPYGHLITLASADTIQAIVGSKLLLETRVDPLFRKYSDIFGLMVMTLGTALIFPTFDAFGHLILGVPYFSVYWGRHFAGMVFSILILTPFILRWCAKVRFSRTPVELAETIAIFFILIMMGGALFLFDVTNVFGVNLVYLILFPLFWIALRLRPRFLTLALFVTALFAVAGVLVSSTPATFSAELFAIQTLLITFSAIFFVIVALEEDRRLHTNLMRSQVSALQNAVARISNESQAKNDFIAVLAHELRNPLAPVVSAIDYLKISAPRDADEMETLDMMDSRMKIVRRLLDDLLDVSRISEGKLTIKNERVGLDMILKRSILSTEHHIRERHQKLTYRGSPEPLFVSGDAVRLEQVFSNLITNASKYSDPGDSVSIILARRGVYAEIRIRDEGVGIAKESLQHIFTPFHQVGSGKRTQKGLGIGLALVQNFVQVHGGTVQVQSEGLNKGSQFIVLLPLSFETDRPIASDP